MKAMRLDTPSPIRARPLVARELEPPRPGRGEIQIAARACALCRTDLQICEGDLPARRLPIVPGHQVIGVVEEVGPGVADWRIGDRAGVAWLAGACGRCRFCTSGRENLCPDATFTGWDCDGGFATSITARADFALHVPESFTDIEAAPLLCGGVIGYRSLKRSGIQPGGRLGLFGFGASASLAIQVAVYWGCHVFVWTRSDAEQSRARALGAVWAGGYQDSPAVEMDAAVTFAPSGDVVVAALGRVAPGGIVAINAIHLDRIPEFSYDLLWRERSLRSVANFTREDARDFLDLAAVIPVRTEVQVFPLEQANEALALLARGALRATAVLAP